MPITLTPEQTFGFGSVPLTSYFKPPAGGSRNTQFSPQARAMLQQDEMYQQQQRQMEADQLVNDLLGQAPGLSDEQINQTLIENPNIFRGRGAEAIQGYQQFRQQAATPADQKLGTYFYTKIQEDKDPRHLQNFQRRMLDEGMSANDAWEAYRTDQFNEPLMQQLAEAGVPREQFSQYMTDTGHFDPVEVSREVARQNALKSRSRTAKEDDPVEKEMGILNKVIERTEKAYDAATTKEEKALLKARLDSYNQRLQKATDETLSKLRPEESAPAGTVKPSSFLQRALEIQKIPVKPAAVQP